jgi:hypothetical protein
MEILKPSMQHKVNSGSIVNNNFTEFNKCLKQCIDNEGIYEIVQNHINLGLFNDNIIKLDHEKFEYVSTHTSFPEGKGSNVNIITIHNSAYYANNPFKPK